MCKGVCLILCKGVCSIVPLPVSSEETFRIQPCSVHSISDHSNTRQPARCLSGVRVVRVACQSGLSGRGSGSVYSRILVNKESSGRPAFLFVEYVSVIGCELIY